MKFVEYLFGSEVSFFKPGGSREQKLYVVREKTTGMARLCPRGI
jgi:hypothetical protein